MHSLTFEPMLPVLTTLSRASSVQPRCSVHFVDKRYPRRGMWINHTVERLRGMSRRLSEYLLRYSMSLPTFVEEFLSCLLWVNPMFFRKSPGPSVIMFPSIDLLFVIMRDSFLQFQSSTSAKYIHQHCVSLTHTYVSTQTNSLSLRYKNIDTLYYTYIYTQDLSHIYENIKRKI